MLSGILVVKELKWLMALQHGHLISKLPVPMAKTWCTVLTLAPIFVTLLHFFCIAPAVSDKIRPPVQVTAL